MAADPVADSSLFRSTPSSRRTARTNEALVYSETDHASFRAFRHHFRAYCDDKGWLSGLSPPLSKLAWAKENKYDLTSETEATVQAYATYVSDVKDCNRKCYNSLVQWPGVTTPRVMDLMEQEFDKTRDARGLIAKMAAHASYAKPTRQAKVKNKLSQMHAVAHSPAADPRINSLTVEQLSDLLEAWWYLWTLSDANNLADPTEYVDTALSISIKRSLASCNSSHATATSTAR